MHQEQRFTPTSAALRNTCSIFMPAAEHHSGLTHIAGFVSQRVLYAAVGVPSARVDCHDTLGLLCRAADVLHRLRSEPF
eukprot:6181682-Pleurochrysis_carterae.AAC.3